MLRYNLLLIIAISVLLVGGSIAIWATTRDDSGGMVSLPDASTQAQKAASAVPIAPASMPEVTKKVTPAKAISTVAVEEKEDGEKDDGEKHDDGKKDKGGNEEGTDIAVSDVPENVIAAANKVVDGEIKEAEKDTEKGTTEYKIEKKVDGKQVKVEVKVDADGKVIKVEKDGEGEKGDSGGKDKD